MPLHPDVQPIIDAMGGPIVAARKLGCAPESFYQWRRVPRKWVDAVAAHSGIPVADLPKPNSYDNRKD